ncbi:MAG: hypothetical protein K0B11_19200 [Mariniphaga sp.]|nr:hypothetical protein [Mariniphaga sp.]
MEVRFGIYEAIPGIKNQSQIFLNPKNIQNCFRNDENSIKNLVFTVYDDW